VGKERFESGPEVVAGVSSEPGEGPSAEGIGVGVGVEVRGAAVGDSHVHEDTPSRTTAESVVRMSWPEITRKE
jgi:hypothetical protein